MKPRAFLFDAYGTLFDIHSGILREGQSIGGDLSTLSAVWRQRQLEHTWLRSLMECYEDFWDVTQGALLSALRQLKIEASAPQLEGLMQAYLYPSAFLDVKAGLQKLKGSPLAILSNGSPKMLESAVNFNQMELCFTEIISVDSVKTYKPSHRVYALGAKTLGLRPSEILFVSSNWWDVAGAKVFGYRVCWCDRSMSEMEFAELAPDITVHRLDEIADCL